MQEILVCGSVAIDVIGKYRGKFGDYEKRYGLSKLNVSLQLASVDFSFGGCGMNIAWGLNQLGVGVIPLSVAGSNFRDTYQAHLEHNGIDTTYITVDDSYENCALAVILTDDEGNQLTAFHSGASVSPLRVKPAQVAGIDKVKLALLAPEDAPIMLKQARGLAALGIDFMFDPGQGLADFNKDEVDELINLAESIVVNEHEWEILMKLTASSKQQMLEKVAFIIITAGQSGSKIYASDGQMFHIPVVPCEDISDPTGCGDAYRAGFLTGLLRGKDLLTCGRVGALVATYNLESRQTQQYQLTSDDFQARYLQVYGESVNLWLPG